MVKQTKQKLGPGSPKERGKFSVKVVFVPTGEIFPLQDVTPDKKIEDLKDMLEFATGIPSDLQRVRYLDKGDLLDDQDVRAYDMVPGATLQLEVWQGWHEIMEAAAGGDIDWVFRLGVTDPTDYKTPMSEYMTKRARKAWLQQRAFVALCIAAHRGHNKLVARLVEEGAGDVNATTPLGRTALHLAAAVGRGHIIDTLLEKGADIDAVDGDGKSALAIAEEYGFKSCERHLFLFRWQDRAKRSAPSQVVPLRAHQMGNKGAKQKVVVKQVDTLYPVWKRGAKSQVYMTNILPPQEFEGSGMGAPLHGKHPSIKRREMRDQYLAHLKAEEKNRNDPTRFDEEDEDLPAPEKPPGWTKKPENYKEWIERKQAEEKKIRDAKKAKKAEEEAKRKKEEGEEDGEERGEEEGEDKDKASSRNKIGSRGRMSSRGKASSLGKASGRSKTSLRTKLSSRETGKDDLTFTLDLDSDRGGRERHRSPLAHGRRRGHVHMEDDPQESDRRMASVSPRPHAEDQEHAKAAKQEGALRVYLKTLGRSRYGTNYEEWLDEMLNKRVAPPQNTRPRPNLTVPAS